jgi:predicted  nucleic acid-binding Zn-ribbon protein
MSNTNEHEIDVQLERLEEEERDISLRRRRLHDRIAIFPENAAKAELERREREISKERRELHERIDDLRVRRNELRGQHGDAAR